MKRLALFVLPAAAIAASAYGCGGSDTGTTGTGGAGGGTTTSTTATTGTGGQGGATTTTSTTSTTVTTTATTGSGGAPPTECSPPDGVVLAINKLFFGDTNPDGSPNKANGWKQYGFNVDGLTSTASSLDVCQPAAGGSKANAYPDGDNGIDNSFGKNILPLLLQSAPTFPAQSNQNIADGSFTVILKFAGLLPGADQGSIVTKLYGSTPLGAPAKFDGTDCWPVAPESLEFPFAIETANVSFPTSGLAANHWDSGTTATFALGVPLPTGVANLTIHHAKISMDFAADHLSATSGMIGGVLDTEEFAFVVKQLLGAQFGFCNGPIVDGILAQIRQASDIMKDGSQNPAAPCDGISIGLGFTMRPIAFGAVGDETPPPNTPCP